MSFDSKEGVAFDLPVYVSAIYETTKGGYRIERKSRLQGNNKPPVKSGVTELSRNSRMRLAYTASNASCDWLSMITLTYGDFYPTDGKDAKKDLNRFLTLLRKKVKGIKYLWFLEFQKRGAVHFHVLISEAVDRDLWPALADSWVDTATDYIPIGTELDGEAEKVRWFNSLERYDNQRGNEKHGFWENAKNEGGLSRYAVKYASKPEQKTVPEQFSNVGRFWGGSRGLVKESKIIGDYRGLNEAGMVDILTAILDAKGIEYKNAVDWIKYLF